MHADILSCLVHTRPGSSADIAARLASMAGVEVHGRDGDRLVVTVEDTEDTSAADGLAAVDRVDGVVGTILIAHYDGSLMADAPPPGGTAEADARARLRRSTSPASVARRNRP